MTNKACGASRDELLALAGDLCEFTALRYAGDCKCGKCQLVPREVIDRAIAALRLAASPDHAALAMREALEEIDGMTVHLRQGGPDIMDLQGLSDALERATSLANDALQAAAIDALPVDTAEHIQSSDGGATRTTTRVLVDDPNSASGKSLRDVETTTAPSETKSPEPTPAQVNSACMSFRHDFGLLSVEQKGSVRFMAREWLLAWQKEGFCKSPEPSAEPVAWVKMLADNWRGRCYSATGDAVRSACADELEIVATRQAPVIDRDAVAGVSVMPMRLADGQTHYFVEVKVGDREVVLHVFREEYRAIYQAALYKWLLNAGEKPEPIASGPEDWPAKVTYVVHPAPAIDREDMALVIANAQRRKHNFPGLDKKTLLAAYRDGVIKDSFMIADAVIAFLKGD